MSPGSTGPASRTGPLTSAVGTRPHPSDRRGVLPGAGVAASNQFGNANQTDVFAISNQGQLMVASVNGTGMWNWPTPISPTTMFQPGGGVAASNQFGNANQTDVFAISNQGQLMVAWINEIGAPPYWVGPAGIGPLGIFPPGAAVAASEESASTRPTFSPFQT